MHVHQALQSRSRESQERLLDAALRLLDRLAWEDVSIAAIAAEAGMSVGGYYARFRSKDALLLVLHERYEERRTERFTALFDSGIEAQPLPRRVAALVEATADWMQENRGVLRTFLLRFWSRPDEFDGAFGARLDGLYQRAVALLEGDRRPSRRAQMAVVVLAAACRDHLVLKPAPNPGALHQPLKSFKREMTLVLLSYLNAATESDE